MPNYKASPSREIQHELRNQRTQEGADWVSAPSSQPVLSASDSASRGRVVLGRRVPTTTANGNHGGHGDA